MSITKQPNSGLKKLFTFAGFFLLGLTTLTAQTSQTNETKKTRPVTKFRAGDIEFKAGVGILPTYLLDDSKSLVVPTQLTLGYRINSNFSVNAFAGYSSSLGAVQTELDGSVRRVQKDVVTLGLRAEAHMTRIQNVDVYGGFMLAQSRPTTTITTLVEPVFDDTKTYVPTPFNPNGPSNSIIVGGFIGGAWYFAKNVSVFGEIGYGTSLATAGLGYKF